MKTINKSLQTVSFSTYERQKKFSRKTDLGSRSKSSRSDSKSLSKFFIRNLQPSSQTMRLQQVLNKNILKDNNTWSPPKRQATPSKTQVQKKITFTKQQMLKEQAKQINNLKQQITKYRDYIHKQTEIIKKQKEQIKSLKVEVVTLRKEISQKTQQCKTLSQTNKQFDEKIRNKQMMLECLQKEQGSIKKIKTSIFQSRLTQFENERQQLSSRIKQLQSIINDLKSNNLNSYSPRNSFSSNLDRSVFSQDDRLQRVEGQLYQAREQIKKMQISEACNRRKSIKQVEAYKMKRDKQYQDLKKRFSQFLAKYKLTMKKFATFQVKCAKERNKCDNKQRSNSIESQVSLTLSQD